MAFRFPIEPGHVMMFARALGDPAPNWGPGAVAPPTFVEAGAHFDPDSRVRPQPGVPWFGSAREASGGVDPWATATGSAFHAETHFEYRRHPVVGDVLIATERDGDTWEKVGRRGGRLVLRDWFVDYVDQHGEHVVTARTVSVATDNKVPPPAGRVGATGTGTDLLDEVADTVRGDGPVAARELAVGDSRAGVVLRNLSRTQVVQYAGASGDFSPQHTDEYYNTRAAGYPTVFGHGMLSMGATGRLLTDWLGDGVLTRFGVRFVQQVWPGDSLLATARVTSVVLGEEEASVELDVRTTNQLGEDVLVGSAAARLPA